MRPPLSHKRQGDLVPFKPTDVVIVITGPVGSGKSKLINTLLGESRQDMHRAVGDESLSSVCTQEVGYTIIESNDVPQFQREYRLILVDTPGFDCSLPQRSDEKVLQDTFEGLKRMFPKGTYRGGVINLHELSRDRLKGLSESGLNARLLKTFESRGWHRQLAIFTTKWKYVEPEDREKRHERSRKYWNSQYPDVMHDNFTDADLDSNATVTSRSAWNFVNDFLSVLEQCPEIDIGQALAEIQPQPSAWKRILQTVLRALGRR